MGGQGKRGILFYHVLAINKSLFLVNYPQASLLCVQVNFSASTQKFFLMWLFRSSGSLHLLMVSVHHSLQGGKSVDQKWGKVLSFRGSVGPITSFLCPQSGFMQMCLCGGAGLSEKEVQEVKLIQSWRQTGTVTVRRPENQFTFTLLHSWWECILRLV